MRPPLPKYRTVKAVLQARLERELTPGARLPSELSLCRDFGVSRITIQQALSLLGSEGRIRREQGRGTFYLGDGPHRTEQRPSELLETLIRHREGASTRVLHNGIQPPPARVAERLGLGPGEKVVALERVGLVEGEPIVFIYSYLPLAVGSRIRNARRDLRRMSLAALLQDEHGIQIASVRQTISASLADPSFAGHLGVEVGAPVLEGERTYLDRAGRPVFCTTSFYRADRHCFVVTVKDWR